MIEKLDTLKQEALKAIGEAPAVEEIDKIRVTYLGRKGAITEILRSLSQLPLEERKQVGERANKLRAELEAVIDAKAAALKQNALRENLQSQKVDISPRLAYPFPQGHTHPIQQTIQEMSDILGSLGFSRAEGPEVETDWYNFEALNIPPDHPARDSQDTFYLTGHKQLLRTHTSPVQVHVMETQKPPVRIIVPGKVFRNEATDASHLAMFHQIEGLAVDEGITFSDLKGTLTLFIHRFFGSKVSLRFRPSHFQFTEPSAEVDIQCVICGGKGCRVCKNSGWLEMLGCGMVHPNVFKAVNYDSEKYTGFAFGLGVERFAMRKYGVEDMRMFFENDLRFLRQL